MWHSINNLPKAYEYVWIHYKENDEDMYWMGSYSTEDKAYYFLDAEVSTDFDSTIELIEWTELPRR